MKTVSMSGSPRENVGKKDAKLRRAEGKIPCVLYGGKEQYHFSADETDFKKIVFTPYSHLIDLKLEGSSHKAILKDIQYHPVTDKILHADFYEVAEDKPIVISVPLKFTGTAPGVLRGGKLVKKARKLNIKAKVNDLPDDITVSINKLDIGQSIKVSDVKLDKVEVMEQKGMVLATVASTRNVEPAPGK